MPAILKHFSLFSRRKLLAVKFLNCDADDSLTLLLKHYSGPEINKRIQYKHMSHMYRFSMYLFPMYLWGHGRKQLTSSSIPSQRVRRNHPHTLAHDQTTAFSGYMASTRKNL